jgi:hypothetical protein
MDFSPSTCQENARVLLYSMPIIMTLNYFGERNLTRSYTSQSKIFTTRLLYSLMSVMTVLAINHKLSKGIYEKMCDKDRAFLREWGHISPYHSSLRESDSSVEDLISY